MRAAVPAFAFALLCGSPSHAAEPLQLSYQIKIEPAEGRVTVGGEMRGERPEGAKGYASLGLKKLVKIRHRQEEGLVVFAYELPIDQETFKDPFQPVLNPEHFTGFLGQMLVVPHFGDAKFGPISVALETPEGWTTATSRGFTDKLELESLDDLAGTLVCAGDYKTHSFELENKGKGSATKFYIAVRGQREWEDAEFFDEFKRLARGQMDFFGGSHPAPQQFLALHLLPRGVNPGVPAFNQRAPGHDSILALHTPARPRGHFEFLGMLAHEHLHNWYPNAMRSDLGPWFMEGLNDYVAYRGLLANKLHTREQFTGMLSKWFREYLHCVANNDKRLMPYRRGMIAGWVLDIELRRATGGEQGLTDVLLALIDTEPEGGVVQRKHLLAMLEKVSGGDMEPLYKHLVEDEGAIDLAKHLRGTGFKIPEGKAAVAIDPATEQEKALFEAIMSE